MRFWINLRNKQIYPPGSKSVALQLGVQLIFFLLMNIYLLVTRSIGRATLDLWILFLSRLATPICEILDLFIVGIFSGGI